MLITYSRCVSNCSPNWGTGMQATEVFMDFFGQNLTPTLLATSDNGVVMCGLVDGYILRAVKLNEKGKLLWSIYVSLGTLTATGSNFLSVVEDNRDPENIFLVFQGTFYPNGESYVKTHLAKCDLETCTQISTNGVVNFSGNYNDKIMMTFLKTPNTKKIYSLGIVAYQNQENHIVLSEYDAAGFSLNEITGTAFSIPKSYNTIASLSLTTLGTILLIFYSPSGIASYNIVYYEFDEASFPVHTITNSYTFDTSTITKDLASVVYSNKVILVASNRLYIVAKNYTTATLIDAMNKYYSITPGLDDSYTVIAGYESSAAKVLRFSQSRSCFIRCTSETTLSNFYFTSVTKSYKNTFYWVAGYSSSYGYNYGVFIYEDLTPKTCISPAKVYKNSECLSPITSGCASGCSTSCLKAANFNACISGVTPNIVLYNARPTTKKYIFSGTGSKALVYSGCNNLCGGMCETANDNNKCSYYCSALSDGIDDSQSGAGICQCLSGFTIGTINQVCVKVSGCSDLCDSGECNGAGLCSKCKQIPGMLKKKNGIFYECTCILIYNKDNSQICAQKSDKCHSFCNGVCTKEGDYNSCYGCNSLNTYLVETKTRDVSTCACISPRVESGNLCALNANCDKNCNGLCMLANDNTKCVGGCVAGYPSNKIKNNGDGTFTCSSLLEVSLKLKTDASNIDRCKGVEFLASVTPTVYFSFFFQFFPIKNRV